MLLRDDITPRLSLLMARDDYDTLRGYVIDATAAA